MSAGPETPASGSSPQERERKWLVWPEDVPDFVWEYPEVAIEQGYAAVDPDRWEVRFRNEADAKYTLTFKSQGDEVRDEIEGDLDEAEFKKLWPTTLGYRISKGRRTVPILSAALANSGLKIELDRYRNQASEHIPVERRLSRQILIGEVEFPNELTARTFVTPSWFGPEVTMYSGFKNRRLAYHGLPDEYFALHAIRYQTGI